mgnify:CR=1 FL=1
MLTKYRFEIEGAIRTDTVFPLKVNDYFIDFEVKNGKIIALEIIEPTDLTKLPKVTGENGKLKSIDIKGDNILSIRPHLKLAEGLLSTFGLRSIDVDSYTIKWIPSNDDEKKLLELYEFSFGYEDPDDYKETIPFSLVAQSIIAGFENKKYEVSLSFFRKGKNDMASRSYIDAFYDFYFVLESLFGEGKTKNSHIEKNLLASSALTNAINKTKKKENLIDHLSQKTKNSFDYMYSTPEEIIKHIVKRRGFLHHQNPKHPEAWKPDLQKQYHLDAAFIMDVSYHLIWGKVLGYIYDDNVINILNTSYRMGK